MAVQLVENSQGILCWFDVGYISGKRNRPDPKHGHPVGKPYWILRCRECGAEHHENGEGLKKVENPSGVLQEVCDCGGVLDSVMKNLEET